MPRYMCPECEKPHVVDQAADLGDGPLIGWTCKELMCSDYNNFRADPTLTAVARDDVTVAEVKLEGRKQERAKARPYNPCSLCVDHANCSKHHKWPACFEVL